MAYDLGNLSNVTSYLNQYQGYKPTNGSMNMPSQGWDGWSGYNPTNTYSTAVQAPQSAPATAQSPSVPQLSQRGLPKQNGAPVTKAPWQMPTLPTNSQYSLDQVTQAMNQYGQNRFLQAQQHFGSDPKRSNRMDQLYQAGGQVPSINDNSYQRYINPDQRDLYHSFLRANGLMQNFGTPGSYVNYDYGEAAPWMQYLTGA
jgi:hypothetical protein